MNKTATTVLVFALALLGWLGCAAPAAADTYSIKLDPAARSEPGTGRVILFFIKVEPGRTRTRAPISAPFFESPQPIASVAVENFKPGDVAVINGDTPAFPDSLDKLEGQYRIQALLDADQTERSHEDGPGNVHSEAQLIELTADKDESFEITLTQKIDPPGERQGDEFVKWVKVRSNLLSDFYGRDVYHRAGVALPKAYKDPAQAEKKWPAIYVIPGYGGRDDAAMQMRRMLHAENAEQSVPQAVYIVLDPEAPLGHHGFCDSANNGPRGKALIEEFIPYLESQFRLSAKPEGRIVTGHSSGGWSSLWLQLNYPDTFGACWSSAPDPIDFSAFQMTDLYTDFSMFTDTEGNETPSYRGRKGDQYVTRMTVSQEVAMEQAIDPDGRSGQQWAAWVAMFSPRDEDTKLPVPMFDPKTGAISKRIVRAWSRYDMAYQMQNRWNVLGPIVVGKVRLVVGDHDSYFLNRAVERFKEKVERMKREYPQFVEGVSGGYIEIVPDADHSSVIMKTRARWNQEMRDYLRANGFTD